MQTDIKCMECDRITRNFELGKLFYTPSKPSESIVIENLVVCPKCKKNVSNRKFLVKENEFLLSLATANMCMSVGDIQTHLKGAFPVDEHKYDSIKMRCAS